MLVRLTIRNVALIDRLDVAFGAGLCALTGETGAGKSILLDALALALGKRADAGLVSMGASGASVSALFELAAAHPARRWLEARAAEGEGALLVRRTLGRDGRSRAFVNDQPVTVASLAELGGMLVEIYGQHDRLGLMDTGNHRAALDHFGGLTAAAETCARAFADWRRARDALSAAERREEKDQARRDELEAAVDEIAALAPAPEEEEALAEERRFLMAAEAIARALSAASQAVTQPLAVEEALSAARRAVAQAAREAGGKLDELSAAFERAAFETGEAVALLDAAGRSLEAEPGRLDDVEQRLFALRAVARKHGVTVSHLAALGEELAQRLADIEAGGTALSRSRQAAEEAGSTFRSAAGALGGARAQAASRLDKAVARELGPLKLGAATFETLVRPLPEARWGAHGAEQVSFRVATNPDTRPGELRTIASGGELSRFMLALSVALARTGGAGTMIFDEIDTGIGGATAHAVGERLARLAERRQVLVVTHQPQVAALADRHYRVAKKTSGKVTETSVEPLAAGARREEVARMLAGAEITQQARAAADRLIEAGPAAPEAP